jgi:hypothetical protein
VPSASITASDIETPDSAFWSGNVSARSIHTIIGVGMNIANSII